MGKVPLLLTSAVVALVFGFLGSFVAVSVFAEDLRGPQGATGLTGPRGEDGQDGTPGEDGEPGPAGPRGKAAKAQDTPVDLGTGTADCAGQSVEVVVDVQVVRQQVRVTRETVCIVR